MHHMNYLNIYAHCHPPLFRSPKQRDCFQPEQKMQKQERGCTTSVFKTADTSGYFIIGEKVKSVTKVPSIRAAKRGS